MQLRKWIKRTIVFTTDTSAIFLSWTGAFWLSSTFQSSNITQSSLIQMSLIQCLIYIYCDLYRGIWRFASLPDLLRIVRAVLTGTVLNIIYAYFNDLIISYNVFLIYALLLVSMLGGSRLLYRLLKDYPNLFKKGKRTLIIGAGSAGEGLIRDLCRSTTHEYLPVGFVDDDPNRQGCEVHGIRVLGKCQDIPTIVLEHHIELIFFAIPSLDAKRRREIHNYCEAAKIPFRTLPGLKNIADGVVKISSLREILLEDLLGREEVAHNWQAITNTIAGKTILVTGGGGSIGSELCRQICNLNPKNLIIVDFSEFNLYTIDMELSTQNHIKLYSHLCDVTDKHELEKIFKTYNPELVFHVAAYKHVPLLENHIRVAMQNNIIGTKMVAELADRYHVKTFVLISTDKAVNPTNIMGATKRASEVFCQTLNLRSETDFITVRFGNVLDSAGSVIPLFRQQLANGGPITVTHPQITRYFMTIPEASQLILQATVLENKNKIFVLDMGEAINIRYLAEQMIKLSGKIVDRDISIIYTGLRPGEKLHEELFHENEQMDATAHPQIRQAKVRYFDWAKLTYMINDIESACALNQEHELRRLLKELVPEYREEASEIIEMDNEKESIFVLNN